MRPTADANQVSLDENPRGLGPEYFHAPWCVGDTGTIIDQSGNTVAISYNPFADHLLKAAPEMFAALLNVRKLIAEAAMTGFNWKDGDWADRLFASQKVTSDAIRKAEGRQ